jgi:hypothetical protein
MSLWKQYGLAEIKGKTGLGKVKRDLAMLFLARCLDLYLKDGGKLGFLMPFTAFKTQAGAGFRSFLARKTRIHVVHDLVTLYPFEGAVNRTSAVVVERICELDPKPGSPCEKGLGKAFEENMKGVKHIIWVNPSGKPIPADKPLEEVLKETRRHEAIMASLEYRKPETPWMQVTPKALEAVRKLLAGTQYYEAHEGVNVALNQVYYVQIKGKTSDGKLIITNPPEPGAKKKVKQVEAVVEPDLVYPLIRGRDVKKWYVEFKNRYVIVPHDSKTAKPLPETDLKVKLPLTYQYLNSYRNGLENRSIHKLWGKSNPFYAVYDIGTYTFAPYKVVWKRTAGAITGKALSFVCAVVEPINGKPVVPDDTTILLETKTPEEAHYIVGLLNSTIVRAIIASYTVEIHQETHIVDVIKIPKFDQNNGIHRKIAELSKRAHELARCIHAEIKPSYCMGINAEEDLRRVERELDLVVAQLFGLSEEDLREFERLMTILSGGELPVEEEVEVPEEPLVTVSNTLIRPNVESYVEVDVVNPSREEITFYYELPGRGGSFKLVEGRYRLPVPPLNPGSYGCALRYVWRGVEKVLEFTIEVSEETGPRRRRTLADLG